jgi:hypothetical protein
VVAGRMTPGYPATLRSRAGRRGDHRERCQFRRAQRAEGETVTRTERDLPAQLLQRRPKATGVSTTGSSSSGTTIT